MKNSDGKKRKSIKNKTDVKNIEQDLKKVKILLKKWKKIGEIKWWN